MCRSKPSSRWYICLKIHATGGSQVRNFYDGFLWHISRKGHRMSQGNKTHVSARLCLNISPHLTGSLKEIWPWLCEDWFLLFLQGSEPCRDMSVSTFLYKRTFLSSFAFYYLPNLCVEVREWLTGFSSLLLPFRLPGCQQTPLPSEPSHWIMSSFQWIQIRLIHHVSAYDL